MDDGRLATLARKFPAGGWVTSIRAIRKRACGGLQIAWWPSRRRGHWRCGPALNEHRRLRVASLWEASPSATQRDVTLVLVPVNDRVADPTAFAPRADADLATRASLRGAVQRRPSEA